MLVLKFDESIKWMEQFPKLPRLPNFRTVLIMMLLCHIMEEIYNLAKLGHFEGTNVTNYRKSKRGMAFYFKR